MTRRVSSLDITDDMVREFTAELLNPNVHAVTTRMQIANAVNAFNKFSDNEQEVTAEKLLAFGYSKLGSLGSGDVTRYVSPGVCDAKERPALVFRDPTDKKRVFEYAEMFEDQTATGMSIFVNIDNIGRLRDWHDAHSQPLPRKEPVA